MRLAILYHPKSDHVGKVEEYAHEYHRRHPDRELELVSLETKPGWEMAKLYDVVRYPAVLAIEKDGHMAAMWQEEQLPLMSEIDSYSVHSDTSTMEHKKAVSI